ncbi:MAG: Ldh family oxidoreductase [Bacteroidetes bacterium]|nr:Ldh family oxidoreductase [Bacteroidota bacterium]
MAAENEIFPWVALKTWVENIFVKNDFSRDDAQLAASVLIAADLRGIDSHGVARLSGYLRLIEKGRIQPNPLIKIIRETASTATMDAGGAIGLVSAPKAMQIAIQKAKIAGSGWVAINNSNHFGIAAFHSMMALEHDMIGFAVTNASPLVTPAGGRERMLGTNPICVAIPALNEPPFVLDMATSAASNGKLEIAERAEKEIPEGWLIKEDGSKSRNPSELKNKGMVLTLGSDMEHGSYKGYGLSAFVDIFSGVLSGANFGPWVPPFVSFLDPAENAPGKGIGHFVGAWSIDGFREAREFKENMDLWIQRFRKTEAMDINNPVQIPGDNERNAEVHRKVHGIPLNKKVHSDLLEIAEKYQLELPK